MPRPSQIVLLVEDKRHQMFAQALFRKRGLSKVIRPLAVPAGRGDAKKYVLDSLASEARAIRSRAAEGFLIVMLDADETTVERRLAEVNAKLRENGQDSLEDGKRVECWVPKRNIETWLMCLLERLCAETEDYKRQFEHRYAEESKAVRSAISVLDQKAENVTPPSLRRVVSESQALASGR